MMAIHCKPEQLVLDGKCTKILKAFADACGLVHYVKWSKTNFGLGLEVEVFVKTRQYESALDVFKHGQVPYVSSMREYTPDAKPETVEEFSKKILEGLYGEGRYIRSFKGGDCYMITEDGLEWVERFQLECPRSFEELLMQIDLAGIDWHKIQIDLKREGRQ